MSQQSRIRFGLRCRWKAIRWVCAPPRRPVWLRTHLASGSDPAGYHDAWGMTGLDALRIIRQETDLPVILITGRSEDAYKVLGLEYADDYLVKPFTMPEMLSRIRAVMRRVHPRPAREATIEAGDLRIDLDARLVTLAGRVISLTPKEFDILLTLASRPNRVFTHEELAERAWGTQRIRQPTHSRCPCRRSTPEAGRGSRAPVSPS